MQSTNRRIDESKNSHSGSALLVVLGMLAFMLFSGLAFSVYMRQSRLPTSFLRRTVATRQLAKAALAEAIEEIDTAIGNDPHPGIRANNKQWQSGQIDNVWSHRVFFGLSKGNTSDEDAEAAGLMESPDSRESDKTKLEEQGKTENDIPWYVRLKKEEDDDVLNPTVPTLTLEGLAYLPPNLINEARYYSQRTPTAKWHSFWFDSGRYTYTAIDVSDYFDVNRVYADRPRSSGNRVSLAHLFEKITASGEGESREVTHEAGSGADKWDTFMDSYRVEDGQMPLVSLADLNVAWAKQNFNFGGSAHGNPFRNYIDNDGVAYQGGDSDAEAYRGMTFVTDSWFPKPLTGKTADGETIYDLVSQQPFEPDDLMGRSRYTLTQVISYTDGLFGDDEPLAIRMNKLTKAALWDYLDQDKVPLSLAIPTCEQVPMICAIQPQVTGLNLAIEAQSDANKDQKIGESYPSGEEGVKLQDYTREVTFQINLDGISAAAISAQVAWAYPFLLKGQKAQTAVNTSASDDSFSVDGRLALFLTDADTGDMSARPGEIAGLHLQDHSSVAKSEVLNNAIITFPLNFTEARDIDPQNIYTSSSKDGAANGKIPVQGLSAEIRQNNFGATKRGLVKVTYRWPKMKIADGVESVNRKDPVLDSDEIVSEPVVATGNDTFALLKKDGTAVTDYSFLRNGGKKNMKLNLAVWLRVTDADDKTVDLAPACLMDDSNLNNVNNDSMANKLGDYNPYPLLRLDVGASVELTLAKFASGDLGTFELKDTQLVTGDPRYNHAPEDWQVNSSSTMEKSDLAQLWYDREYAYANGKDGDIYMATSDQGIMQSVYELAFLPRLQNDGLTKNGMNDGFIGDYAKPEDNAQIRASNGTLLHRSLMWKTYSPFSRYNVDDFDELGDGRIVSGDSSMKVNPYSDSVDVLMAAFANTPHDWRMASTNNPTIWKNGEPVLKTSQFNKEHVWNGYCPKEKGSLCWDCLRELADKFQAKVRTSGYAGNWEDAFRDLGWSFQSNELLSGVQLDGEDSSLFSVDKKFLYGFWHDSFAARQQLFLIFVRAEPMMMGGGVSGQSPPQLGARAVALVWRDPTATQNRSGGSSGTSLANPHRTRILFYHQFD